MAPPVRSPRPQRPPRGAAGAKAALRAALGLALVLGCRSPAQPSSAAAPPALFGPWVLAPGPAGATVAWTTALPSVGEVRYGRDGAQGSVAREPAARTEHRVPLTGLSPGTRYAYRVEAAPPREGSFTTAPDPKAARPFRVLVYGDNRTNGGDHELLARAAASEPVQLALHTGDMVADAHDDAAWADWFDAERELLSRTALVPAVGNHEITDRGATYARHFLDERLPTYHAFDYGPLHVLVLDSFEQAAGADPRAGAISDAQRAWAEADVRQLGPDKHLWLLVHQGPHSHPLHPRPGHGGSEPVRALVASLMGIHPVEAIWAGHEHFYERNSLEGMRTVVVGGGGAPLEDPDPAAPGVLAARKALSYVLVDVCGCHVTGRAKDIFGAVLDTFTLSDCAAPCGAAAPAEGAK